MCNNRFYEYDKRGVRAFVGYAYMTGYWKIECYRKKTDQERKNDADWQLKREGNIQTYPTRQEAEIKALELAEAICIEYGF